MNSVTKIEPFMVGMGGLLMFMFSWSSQAQPLPSVLTPTVINQVQSMSPAQQQALAQQYGVKMPATQLSESDASSLGMRGEELTPMTGDEEEQVQRGPKDSGFEAAGKVVPRYGLSIFTKSVSTFAPTDDAPIPVDYRVGVGDQVVVQLFGKENGEYRLTIGRDGSVSFPKLGAITLAGLTFESVQKLIETRIDREFIGVQAAITLGRLRAINVFMSGEVKVPGAYSVSALATVSQTLFQAGGVTDIGSLRNIQVLRGGKVVSRFDVYDLLMKGGVTGDIRLQSGDVVFVPTVESVVEVRGEVRRPMRYELSGGESVYDLIEMAGGYTKDAFASLGVLVRPSLTGGLPNAVSLDLLAAKDADTVLRDGDVLSVSSSGAAVANTVKLRGALYRTGDIGWQPGMRVSDILQSAERDLLPGADLTYSLIIRVNNELLDIQPIQFRLADSLINRGGDGDPELQAGDQLLVFTSPDLDSEVPTEFSRQKLLAPVISKLKQQAREGAPRLTATIYGAVKVPGVYPILDGYGVRELVQAAGGLTESAYLRSSELRRLRQLPTGSVVSDYIDIDLSEALAGSVNVSLRSRDSLLVREIPDWSVSDAVVLSGSVNFPGEYRLMQGEKLSDLVARAGGLRPDADPNAAVFTRESIAFEQSKRGNEFAEQIERTFAAKLLTEEVQTQDLNTVRSIVQALKEQEAPGRLLIDLPRALSERGEYDLVLEDGDRLRVPPLLNSIAVSGEVRREGSHTYQPGLTVEDYISLSAGFSERADTAGIYIVRANGSVTNYDRSIWLFDHDKHLLYPGDSIIVPIDISYKESLASWKEITQIFYQSIVSIAAVARL